MASSRRSELRQSVVEGAREKLRQVVRKRTGASAVGKEGKGEEERTGEERGG